MSPTRKERSGAICIIAEGKEKKEEDNFSSSGSMPDPESFDFEEYEDEGPGYGNLNREDNEEPGEGIQAGMKESPWEDQAPDADPKIKSNRNPHDY